jgi:hypothetical protein
MSRESVDKIAEGLREARLIARVHNLMDRIEVCWAMAKVFLDNRDAHGIHDMGVEIQALQRAVAELDALRA